MMLWSPHARLATLVYLFSRNPSQQLEMFSLIWSDVNHNGLGYKVPFEQVERLETLVQVQVPDFDHVIWYIIETSAVAIIYKKNEGKRQRMSTRQRFCLER